MRRQNVDDEANETAGPEIDRQSSSRERVMEEGQCDDQITGCCIRSVLINGSSVIGRRSSPHFSDAEMK